MIKFVPTFFTALRVFLTPFICYRIIGTGKSLWIEASIFFMACLTDFLDGWLAQSMNSRSRLGAMLDPVADKILLFLTSFSLAYAGKLDILAFIALFIVIFRDLLVMGLRSFGGHHVLPVVPLAKLKTMLYMAALFFYILGLKDFYFPFVLLALSCFLSLWSGMGYVIAFLISLKKLYSENTL